LLQRNRQTDRQTDRQTKRHRKTSCNDCSSKPHQHNGYITSLLCALVSSGLVAIGNSTDGQSRV